MARLPQVGGDEGNWGAILNDFLTQSHRADGSLKPAAISSAGVVTSDDLSDHAAQTTNVHGITDTADLATASDLAEKADQTDLEDETSARVQGDTDARARANHTGSQAISTVTGLQTALDSKLATTTASTTYAPLASPALTGTPTAPTATNGTNTTQLATTQFVTTAVGNLETSLDSMYAPAAVPGAPTTGAHVRGERHIDSNLIEWICIQAGTPGTWGPLRAGVELARAESAAYQTFTSTASLTGNDPKAISGCSVTFDVYQTGPVIVEATFVDLYPNAASSWLLAISDGTLARRRGTVVTYTATTQFESSVIHEKITTPGTYTRQLTVAQVIGTAGLVFNTTPTPDTTLVCSIVVRTA